MKIKKEHLKTLWYEDADGNILEHDNESYLCPKGAKFQNSMFPNIVRHNVLELIKQEDVDKCPHPRENINKTYGWIDGIEGRRCVGSREIMSMSSSWPEDIVLSIANSGDYTLKEAILICVKACERCLNVLAHKYKAGDGYSDDSEEYKQCGTSCQFCREVE